MRSVVRKSVQVFLLSLCLVLLYYTTGFNREEGWYGGGITVVEEHHHVWPVWSHHHPPAVVHIDAHPDTGYSGVVPPDANDVFIYQAAKQGWLKTVVWVWPDWDRGGPRHAGTGDQVIAYTGYWGGWRVPRMAGLWSSYGGPCVCEQYVGEGPECWNMEREDIHADQCEKEEETVFEVISVSAKYVLDNPGWLKQVLRGKEFILDFDLDFAAALNNPLSDEMKSRLETISSQVEQMFARSGMTECEFHHDLLAHLSNGMTCDSVSSTVLETMICSSPDPDQVMKTILRSGFCEGGDGMQVCYAQGSADVSGNWRQSINQSLADLQSLVYHLYQDDSVHPVAVTVCRSVRDGYTPASLAQTIENTIIQAIHTMDQSMPVYYHQDLWCGEEGPQLGNIED